jgi:hypothetical protein
VARNNMKSDDDAEQARERKELLAYPGSTGTLGTWVRLILWLLSRLRCISELLPILHSQLVTHIATLSTLRRISRRRGHL